MCGCRASVWYEAREMRSRRQQADKPPSVFWGWWPQAGIPLLFHQCTKIQKNSLILLLFSSGLHNRSTSVCGPTGINAIRYLQQEPLLILINPDWPEYQKLDGMLVQCVLTFVNNASLILASLSGPGKTFLGTGSRTRFCILSCRIIRQESC